MVVTTHSIQPRRAFHSTLSTTFVLDPPAADCSFFALYRFPQAIIIDEYELVDHRLSFEFWGESDLELPVFALNQSAVSLLLIHAMPAAIHLEKFALDIPVHARYGEPGVARTSFRVISIPSPTCFWACSPSTSVSATFSSEPPIANSTMLDPFTHFSVSSTTLHSALLQVPVASQHDLFPVEVGTTAVIFMAFIWLVHRSWRVATLLQSYHFKEQ